MTTTAGIIKATLHCYWISDKHTEEYSALSEKLEGLGLEKFAAIGGNDVDHFTKEIKPLDGQVVHLETKHLFSNQWNTAPTATSASGLRVFDWSEPVNVHNNKLAYGYWLEYDREAVRNLRIRRRMQRKVALEFVEQAEADGRAVVHAVFLLRSLCARRAR